MALLGVYGFDEGEYEGLIALEVGEVRIDAGVASFDKALEIDSDGLIVDHGYPELTTLNAAICASGYLFIDAYDENHEREIIAIELSSGESESIDVDRLAGIAAYDGERLLLETFDADVGQAQFFIYDPEGDSTVPACDPLQSDMLISCFA